MRPSKSDKDKLKFMNEISFVEKKQNVSPWKIVSKSDGQSKNCYGDENTIKKYIKTKVNNDVVNLPTISHEVYFVRVSLRRLFHRKAPPASTAQARATFVIVD